MDFTTMTVEKLEKRLAEIPAELDADGADLDALEAEVRGIKAELESRKQAETRKKEIRSAVANGQGTVTRKIEEEKNTMPTLEKVRSSKEYIDAFANYIKSGDDTECRALLTNLVSGGQVPVPTYIEGRIRTAWERNGLMNLVRKTYIPGILKIGFELSATGAVVHTEGAAAPTEEVLTFGVATLTPQSIKKWIRISDEAIDLGGAEFLDYIYDEITYQIAKQAVAVLIGLIIAAPGASTATAAGVPSIPGAPGLAIVAEALAYLSEDAANPVVVMNRLTHADFIAAITAANFRFDPFENIDVHYSSVLPAYSAAEADATWMIVGDFGVGAQANFPNGDEIRIKYDDLSQAESDLVKLVGREYIGLGVVAPNAFVKVTKGE